MKNSGFALFMLAFGAQAALADPILLPPPATPPANFTTVIEKVSPVVVSVQVVTEKQDSNGTVVRKFRGIPQFEDFFPEFEDFMQRRRQTPNRPPQQRKSAGSGFFISENGHVVTNHHVIQNADRATVKLHDGREFYAEIIGSDTQTDLAVLKINMDEPTPYVRFAKDQPVRVGEWVVAVGNPFNFGGTATVGIVSALGRGIGGAYADFIQIDASINRGNSGGPTFNLRGEVVGVNTAIVSPSGGSVGIGFAIEASAASRIVSKLMETGEIIRGWLGVSIQSMTREIAEARGLDPSSQGAIVSEVIPGSPAEESGFQRGDIITAVNGSDVKDSRDVTRRVGIMRAGSQNSFTIIRDGRTRSIGVLIGKRPNNMAALSPSAIMGVRLAPLDEKDRKRLALRKRDRGVLVVSLEPDSPLAEAGIGVGDALLEAYGRVLKSEQDFKDAIQEAQERNRANLLVAVRKNRSTLFLPVRLKE